MLTVAIKVGIHQGTPGQAQGGPCLPNYLGQVELNPLFLEKKNLYISKETLMASYHEGA